MTPYEKPKPLAFDAYEQLAEAYAARVDTKPHNAYYERPATLSLLPDVRGKYVLDAGCGPGVYSEWLIQHGAIIVAIDASPAMVALAQKRLGKTADVRQMNLDVPLTELGDAQFDLVLSPLVLDYVANWPSAFSEFARVLRPRGTCVFSMTHPFFDGSPERTEDYFQTEVIHEMWKGFGVRVQMPHYRRPLSAVFAALAAAGFLTEAVIEPQPTETFREKDPNHYEELMRHPVFLCLRASKQ